MVDIEEKNINWRVRISEDNLNFLKDFSDEKNLPKMSPGKALEYILNDYRELDLQRFDLRFIANQLKNEVLKELRNAIKDEVAEEMKRIRLGTNNADRNTQILIELLQGFIVADNKETLTTTDIFKPPFLVEAEEVVQERINNYMLKKRSQSEKGDNQ
jgi:hypothetical protein